MEDILCRLCGAPSNLKFELPLVSGLTGHYYECSRCQFLRSDHLDDPAALRIVYSNTLGETDVGAAWRQRCVADRIVQLAAFGLFPAKQKCRLLDYGCGPGYVASLLRYRKGWEVYGFEPYIPPIYLPTSTLVTKAEVLERAPFDVIIASEVLEHFIDPVSDLRFLSEIMADTGFLYVTTGLYRSPGRDKNWTYLAPQGGQHVSFYSRSAINEVKALLGASAVYQVGAEYEWLFVRSRSKSRRAGFACRVLNSLVRAGLIDRIE